MAECYEITIKGLVQGVGFRPFVYTLANELNLRGTVSNNSAGVFIQLQSSVFQKDVFLERLRNEKPAISKITSIEVCESYKDFKFSKFEITSSNLAHNQITRVSPDIGICSKCLEDYAHQPHRLKYPFVNCTNCGPRFSIIESIPYDRPFTTMREFEMCPLCEEEYNNPADRRFHAQPVACNHCGPVYTAFYLKDGAMAQIDKYPDITDRICVELVAGGIVALKGMGGFNWLADAGNEEAIARLRELKKRYSKPFAIMCQDEDWMNSNMEISPAEYEQLRSWRRPIVLLNEKQKLSYQINGDLKTIGVMLPYMGIHYEIFRRSGLKAIVFTSANKTGEPMLKDNDEARDYLLNHSDLYVEYNRRIYNRVDDSVVRLINETPQVMRRARGYAPEPVLNIHGVEGGLAFGAEMTAVFALGVGQQILMSQYIGDLSAFETYEAYKDTLKRLSSLFKFKPQYLICDTHPEYLSSKLAVQIARENNLPLYQVQHHHAHAVSVMVEYGLDEECLALCLDGIGYGDDGQSWGCEVLSCNRTQYKRLSHLPYVSLPGGDKAAKECWRMTVSYFYSLFGSADMLPDTFKELVGANKIQQLLRLLNSPLNRNFTSSAGRLFDAVAALLGICYYNTYQGEAAMKLEQAASQSTVDDKIYSGKISDDWDMHALFTGILSDLHNGVDKGIISLRFHRTLVVQLASLIKKYSALLQLKKVILAGGVFQNRLLSELLIDEIKKLNLKIYYPTAIPCNDGGIAVGQMGVVAALLNQRK